jgi:DNA-binding LacI/PurR family transcriptional regulator
LAAERFLERGVSRFAFIGHEQASDKYVFASSRRSEGFRTRLLAAGASLDEHMFVKTHSDVDAAQHAATELLRSATLPVGVFAHDDVIAAGVYRAAIALGYSVPADVSIIGYDDSDLARALNLSSVNQSLFESGATAARMLRQQMSSPGSRALRVEMPVHLVARESA